MQPAVGYPPGGQVNPSIQGSYQALQLGDNSFNQQGQHPLGTMPQGQYPPGMAQQGMYPPAMYLNPMAMMNMPGMGMEAQNEMMKKKSMNGMQRLEEAKGVLIKQSFIFLDAMLTGCTNESPNVYQVFQTDSNRKKIGLMPILQCKDKSECCPRSCCGTDCLPMQMKVSKEPGILDNENMETTLFLYLDRPWQCACYCLNRPVLNIVLSEDGQSKTLGKVKSPCYGCSIGIQIEDDVGNIKYSIEGSKCQLGYICSPCCCDSCYKFDLEVKDASGQIIAQVYKKTPGVYKSNFATSLELVFPEKATAEEKALLVGGILLIDFVYFENTRRKGGVRRR